MARPGPAPQQSRSAGAAVPEPQRRSRSTSPALLTPLLLLIPAQPGTEQPPQTAAQAGPVLLVLPTAAAGHRPCPRPLGKASR